MTNNAAKKIFTESLLELISERLTLYQSLKVISESKIANKKIAKAASYISEEIEKGNLFSVSLKTCKEIVFDEVYVTFSAFAEETGNLEKTLGYLQEKCKRQNENLNTLINALCYPVFVFLVLIGVVLFFMFSGTGYFGTEGLFGISKIDALKSVGWSFVTFLMLFFAVVSYIWNSICENRLYEAFLAAGFLVSSGLGISSAIGMASDIAGLNSKNGKTFLKAREGLEYGMDLRQAFFRMKNTRLQKKMEIALLMAEKTGNKNEVLLKIADSLKLESERKRKLCLTLVEPAFIVLTGVFLLGITINLVLPVFSNFGI